MIVTDITKRTLTFNPILNTSLRSHGKWGDFLVAIIPLSWCGNILVNSNFILRIIEWQNESSLFTLRIQGKQWYWVYKYDGNAAVMIDSAPKNIGHDRWAITTPSESYTVDSYYQALHLAAQLEFQEMYNVEIKKANISKKILENATLYTNYIKTPDSNIQSTNIPDELYNNLDFDEYFDNNYDSSNLFFIQSDLDKNIKTNISLRQKTLIKPKDIAWKLVVMGWRIRAYNLTILGMAARQAQVDPTSSSLQSVRDSEFVKVLPFSTKEYKSLFTMQFYNRRGNYFVNNVPLIHAYNKNLAVQHYDLLKLDDTQNTYGNMRVLLTNSPVVLQIGILNDHVVGLLQSNIKLKTPLLFRAQINNNLIEPKINQTEDLWGFRQKRYKRLKEFKFTPQTYYNPTTFEPTTQVNSPIIKVHSFILNKQLNVQTNDNTTTTSYVGNLSYRATNDQPYSPTTLELQKTQTVNTNNAYYFYSSLKLNKKRSEVLSVNLARRLLRTKRTLVLPAHVNITVITNSYDVVHSWFIPGLGLKLDCVPGRSTHHTLYVDNVGFYYGQCAEICGRYHHHMPIRVCAIPFEQFLVWWHTKGLPRTLRLHQNKTLLIKDANKPTLHKALIQYKYNF